MSDSLTRAQLQLEYARAMLAAFSEAVPTAADVIGPMPALAVVTDGRAWVAVSEDLAALLGRPAAELVGLTWREIVHPDDVTPSVQAAESVLRGDAARGEHTNRYLTPAGEISLRWRWAKASSARPWVIALAEIVP